MGCKGAPDTAADSSGNSTGGGSVARVDSLKTSGSGVNGGTPNTLDAKNALVRGRPITSPTDSAQKKAPGSIK